MGSRNLRLFESLISSECCWRVRLLSRFVLEDALDLVVIFVTHFSRAADGFLVIPHIHDLVDIIVIWFALVSPIRIWWVFKDFLQVVNLLWTQNLLLLLIDNGGNWWFGGLLVASQEGSPVLLCIDTLGNRCHFHGLSRLLIEEHVKLLFQFYLFMWWIRLDYLMRARLNGLRTLSLSSMNFAICSGVRRLLISLTV